MLDIEADQSGEESGGSDASGWSAHSSDRDADASEPEDADDVMSHRQLDEKLRRERDKRSGLVESSEEEDAGDDKEEGALSEDSEDDKNGDDKQALSEDSDDDEREASDKEEGVLSDAEQDAEQDAELQPNKKKRRIILDDEDPKPAEDTQSETDSVQDMDISPSPRQQDLPDELADWSANLVEEPVSLESTELDFKHFFRSDEPLAAPPDFSDERALALLDYVHDKCEEVRKLKPTDHAELARCAAQLFDHRDTSCLTMLNAKMNSGLVLLIDRLMASGLMVAHTPDGNVMHGKGIVIQEVFRLCNAVLAIASMQQRVKALATDNAEGNMVSLAIAGAPNLSEWQSLLLRICKDFGKAGFRRYRGDVYRPYLVVQVEDVDGMRRFVPTHDLEALNPCTFQVIGAPIDSHAWESIGPIEDVLFKMSNKDSDFELFQAMTKAGGHTIMSIAKYMDKMADNDFPELEPNRGWRSFTNGVLSNVDGLKFYEYGKHTVPSSVVSCRFYKMDFPLDALEYRDWYNIPTPKLTNILSYQMLDPEVQRVVWALFGRLAYKVGDRDKWQVLMMIIGVAGSGKSTLANVFRELFDQRHVAIIPSNIEEKFGLAPLKDAFLCICPEVTKDTDLKRSDLQSMTGGDTMRLAQKGLPSVDHVWHSHLLFLGNGFGNWADLGNSIGRRFVNVMFNRYVRQTKPDLDRELMVELPYIIAKCLLAYQECVHVNTGEGIWNWLPPYFKATQEKLLAQMNPVRAFLNDRSVVMLNPNERLLLSTAFSLYRKFARMNNKFAVEQFTEDMLREAIEDHLGLKLDWFDREGDKGAGTYIIGLMSVTGDVDQPKPLHVASKPKKTEAELDLELKLAAETRVEYPRYGLEKFLEQLEQKPAGTRTRTVTGMHPMILAQNCVKLRRRRSVCFNKSAANSSWSSTSSSTSSSSTRSPSASSSSSSSSSSSNRSPSASSSSSSSSSSSNRSPSASSSTSSSAGYQTVCEMPMVYDPASKFKRV